MFSPPRLLAAWLLSALVAVELRANEPTSSDVAHAFWQAFLDGNADEMGKHYAPHITLKAGSELLKPDYGLNDSGDRSRDLIVDQKSIVRGYHVMFQRVGKQKWKESGQKLRNVQLSFISAADQNRYFAMFGAQPGDRLVRVHTDPDPLFFLLRQDEQRRWRVVAEAFD